MHKVGNKNAESSQVKSTQNYNTSPYYNSLNIPPFLQHEYLKEKREVFRSWQHGIISSDAWFNERSYVICVPTGFGKTTIIDVATAQTVRANGKVIYSLPFVALANQKFLQYKSRFSGYRIDSYYGLYNGNVSKASISISTFEKVPFILKDSINMKVKIKLVIVDEVHYMNYERRGAIVSAIIQMCILMKIRLILLSGTLTYDDTKRLATWIKGYFVSISKPASINIHIISGQRYYEWNDGNYSLQTDISSVKIDNLIGTKKTIVFCSTKARCEENAIKFATKVTPTKPNINDGYVARLNNYFENHDEIKKTFSKGVFYHHAGLTHKQRRMIEMAYKSDALDIIFATTTLSAGVDFPLTEQVIIEGIEPGYITTSRFIPATLLTQMIGRAARVQERKGDAYIFINDQHFDTAISMLQTNIDPLREFTLEEQRTITCYLYDAKLFTCKGEMSLNSNTYFTRTIDIYDILTSLESNKFTKNNKLTQVGSLVGCGGLDLNTCNFLIKVLDKYLIHINLRQNLTFIFIAIPPDIRFDMKYYYPTKEAYLNYLKANIEFVKYLLDEGDAIDLIQKIVAKDKYIHNDPFKLRICTTVYVSMIVEMATTDTTVSVISQNLNIPSSDIKNILHDCMDWISRLTRILKVLDYDVIAQAIMKTMKTLFTKFKDGLSQFVAIGITVDDALKLRKVGIKKLSDLHDGNKYKPCKNGITIENLKRIHNDANYQNKPAWIEPSNK